MGCSASTTTIADLHHVPKQKRGTFTSISTFDSFQSADAQIAARVTKRHGHPTYFRKDGYDIGLRVRV